MNFIGREKELKTLSDNYKLNNGFVVIYGRRRVGKTTLIKEFIKDKPALYFLATEEIESQNIRRFTDTLAEFTRAPHLKNATYTDWIALLRILADYKPDTKKILIIDEFQYLTKTNSAFSSIIQKAWDEYLQNNNIMIILCGSYIRMMKTETLSRESPLYGRRTAQILLKPLRFMELARNYPNKSFDDLVRLFAITGGVPKYLEFFDCDADVFENIRRHVLNTNGFLFEEPLYLLEKEVKDPVSYFSIMKAIASGNHKLSELAGVLELKTNTLSPYLSTLIDLGLVERRVPATEKYPEKSRRGLYSIKDTFIRFWFLFVYPNMGELELEKDYAVLEKIQRDFVRHYLSFIYEDVCREIFQELCDAGKIDFQPQICGSYWNSGGSQKKNVELDILAINHTQKKIFAGECKYYSGDKLMTAEVLYELRKKCDTPEFDGYHVTYGLFTPTGFEPELMRIAKEEGVVLVKGMGVCDI